jgi:hypothetical protein
MLPKNLYSRQEISKSAIYSWATRYLSPKYEYDLTILTLPPFAIPLIDAIRQDFVGGNVLNVQPAVVKQPEDMARPPEIQQDGSGLAPTLYALRHPEERLFYRRHPTAARRSYRHIRRRGGQRDGDLYEKIVSYIQLANDAIRDVNAISDPFNNQLRIVATMEGGDGDVPMPIAALSDGTIKWITLITASRDAKMETIAKFVDAQIRALGNRNFPIVVVLDREGRKEPVPTLKEQLHTALEELGHVGQCLIGISDRCIENWILGDLETHTSYFEGRAIAALNARGSNVEGKNGKAVLKSLMPQRHYDERIHGSKMLVESRAAQVYLKSLSFKLFVDECRTAKLRCPWLAI